MRNILRVQLENARWKLIDEMEIYQSIWLVVPVLLAEGAVLVVDDGDEETVR